MSEINPEDLKLIYVLKIGYNSKGDGMYEFIFSEDETNVDFKLWGWDLEPACDNALPPDEEHTDAVYPLKTSLFNLYCLHEDVTKPYTHGYHTIHALAYEMDFTDVNGNTIEDQIETDEDKPLLVFHYGMTLETVKDMLYERNIILQNDEFVETKNIKLI